MICGVNKKSIFKKLLTCTVVLCLIISSFPAEFEVRVSADQSMPKCHEHVFKCFECNMQLTDYNDSSYEDGQQSQSEHNHVFRCTYEGCECTPQQAEDGTFQMEHDYATTFTVDERPTTDTKGVKSRHCTRCGARIDITELPTLSKKLPVELPKAVIKKAETYESSPNNPVQMTLMQVSADSVVGSNGAAIEFTSDNNKKIMIVVNKSGSDILNSFISKKKNTATADNTADENSGSVKLTLSNISENKGENIFTDGNNQTEGADSQESSVDTQKKAGSGSFTNNTSDNKAASQSSLSSKGQSLVTDVLQGLVGSSAEQKMDNTEGQQKSSDASENQQEKPEDGNTPDEGNGKSILPGNASAVNSGNYSIIGNSGKVINLDSLAKPAYQLDFDLKFKTNSSGTDMELTEFETKIPVTIKLSEETRKALGPDVTPMLFNNHNDGLSAVDSSYDPEKGEITANIDQCSPFELLLYKSDELFLPDSEAVLKLKKTVKTGQSFTACISGFADGDSCVGFSADGSIATIDSNGVITGVSEGKTKVTYYVIRGNKNYKYIIDLTVKNSAGQSLSIRPDRLATDPDGALVFNIYKAVKLGKKTRITLLKHNPGVTVSYSSSDESIASVNPDGYITGLKKGFATISAEVVSGEDRMIYSLLVRVSDGTKNKQMRQYLQK